MEVHLDLDGSIRPGLDILANEIVIALKKRSRFKQNLEIYRPGLVLDHPRISLLEYELARIEQIHAELGRYNYATQESFTDVNGIKLMIQRTPPDNQVQMIPSQKGDSIIRYYQDWIRQSCEPGSDSDTFGETVTADVSALQGIFERITLGKYVAEYKYQQDPESFGNCQGDPDQLRKLIVHKEREQNVLQIVEQLAEHYDFSGEQARKIFQWMIQVTVEVEIRYIQNRKSI